MNQALIFVITFAILNTVSAATTVSPTVINERRAIRNAFKDVIYNANDTDLPKKFDDKVKKYIHTEKGMANRTVQENPISFALVKYLRHHPYLAEFNKHVACIQYDKIEQCKNQELGVPQPGEKNHTKPNLIKLLVYPKEMLKYTDKSCDSADLLYRCVESSTAVANCYYRTAKFLLDLFEYSVKKCRKQLANQSSDSQRKKKSSCSNTAAIVLGIVVAGLLCVILIGTIVFKRKMNSGANSTPKKTAPPE